MAAFLSRESAGADTFPAGPDLFVKSRYGRARRGTRFWAERVIQFCHQLPWPAGNVSANSKDGLPTGVQIAGQRFREDKMQDTAQAIEDRVGIIALQLFARG